MMANENYPDESLDDVEIEETIKFEGNIDLMTADVAVLNFHTYRKSYDLLKKSDHADPKVLHGIEQKLIDLQKNFSNHIDINELPDEISRKLDSASP